MRLHENDPPESPENGEGDQLYNLQSPVQNEMWGALFKSIKNFKTATAEN